MGVIKAIIISMKFIAIIVVKARIIATIIAVELFVESFIEPIVIVINTSGCIASKRKTLSPIIESHFVVITEICNQMK